MRRGSEEGESESTRMDQAGWYPAGNLRPTGQDKVKKRKVADLSWVTGYIGAERFQGADDERFAREEDELYWENVRLDKRPMQDQYTALNEELTSLVRERDEVITENQRRKAAPREERDSLMEDNRYIQKKIAREAHECQKIQAEFVRNTQANEESRALPVRYEKDF